MPPTELEQEHRVAPLEVGGMPGTDDVFSKFDAMVSSIAGALAGKSGGTR